MMNKTKQQKTEHRELASPNGQETGAVSLPSSVGSPDKIKGIMISTLFSCLSRRTLGDHEEALAAVGWEPVCSLATAGNVDRDVRIFLCATGNMDEGDAPLVTGGSFGPNRPTYRRPPLVAVKVLPSGNLDEERGAHLRREIALLQYRARGHPRMLRLLTFVHAGGCELVETEALLGGSLQSHAKVFPGKRLQPLSALYYGAEIASALEFLHERRIAHRDVRAANVVLDHRGHAVLIDFSSAKDMSSRGKAAAGGEASDDKKVSTPSIFDRTDSRATTMCGSAFSMAPEVASRQGHSTACDWWSLGVLIWELLDGISPFEEANDLILPNYDSGHSEGASLQQVHPPGIIPSAVATRSPLSLPPPPATSSSISVNQKSSAASAAWAGPIGQKTYRFRRQREHRCFTSFVARMPKHSGD